MIEQFIFWASSAATALSFLGFYQCNKELKEAENAGIKSISTKDSIPKNKKVLFRAKKLQQQPILLRVPLKSNHIQFLQPNPSLFAYFNIDRKQTSLVVCDPQDQSSTLKISRMGIVLGSRIIEETHTFKAYELNLIRRIHADLAWLGEMIIDSLFYIFKTKRQLKLIFEGPTAGQMTIATRLKSNIEFCLWGQFNGTHFNVQFMSATAQLIYSQLKAYRIIFGSMAIISLVGTMFAAINAFPSILNLSQAPGMKPSNLINIGQKTPNEMKCILCLTNTRNIIFSNCRHFALCYECFNDPRAHLSTQCPLCKQAPGEIKYVTSM